jgi:putative flippase GtrA
MEKLTHHTKQMYSAAAHRGKRLVRFKKIRFGLVGIINTAVDFVVFNVLIGVFGVPIVVANIVSTSVAMITSFGLNKSAVFKGGEGSTKRQIVLFFIVTLAGIWLVQSVIMVQVYDLLNSWVDWDDAWVRNIAKLAGISVGLVWNYLWYSRVVFRKPKS